MCLIHKETGIPVAKGDTVVDFRGETAVVTGWNEPRHSGSTGRIGVVLNAEQLAERGL